MTKDSFIHIMDSKLKLVRTEYKLTQDRMASALGISKKTLVEIEKGRRSLGWTGAVALSGIFSDSEILQDHFGGEQSDIIIALAFEDRPGHFPGTLGGKVWWETIRQDKGYKIQQNIISKHYRVLNQENRRVKASFHLEDLQQLFEELLILDAKS